MELNGLFSRSKFRSSRLKQYTSLMSKDDPREIFDDVVASILDIQGFDTKSYAPRSVYSVNKLYEALALYGPKNQVRISKDIHFDRGVALAYKCFARPTNSTETLNLLKGPDLINSVKLEKSSGLPLMTSKRQSLLYSLNRMEQVIYGIKAPNPCVAYKRTQANKKTRLVWGYPLEMTLIEAQYARPLIDTFKSSFRSPMAFGLSKPVLGTLLEIEVKQSGKYVYTLDYSKFDSSINSLLIATAFKILGTWFSDDDRISRGWDKLVQYFTATPIVMPDGNLYLGKKHGVPSGSYFTQLVDSVVNTILIGMISSRFELSVDKRKFFVLGDDSIFSSDVRLNMHEVAAFLKNYGFKMNELKSKVGVLHFLGAYWVKGLPDLPVEEIVSKALWPENFRVYKNKKREAQLVLASYAGQYLSGWRLAPKRFGFDLSWEGQNIIPNSVESRYLSGSDKYLMSEVESSGIFRPNKNPISSMTRMLT